MTLDLTGQEIKSYVLREAIGQGGFGAVYRADQPSIHREVAIKIIHPQYANQPDFIRRFETEAQLVARLEHPFIVPLYDYWRDPSGAYLVMRLLRGGNLQQALQMGPWDLKRAARLLEQVAAALMIAHRGKVVHRDLKPENILLDVEGNAYLSDFGIAKDISRDDQVRTQSGGLVGSPAYLSPEQVRGEEVSPQTDIYTLGIVLYEMLVGEVPFPDAQMSTLLLLHLQEPLPRVLEKRPGLPAGVDDIIQRATAKEPEDRFKSAIDLATTFRRTALGEANGDRGSVTTTQPPRPRSAAATPTKIDLPEPENPYKGLRSFEEADSEDFFGREALVNQLLGKMADEDYSRFMALVGPSGSGKSSVVKAGLLPALRGAELPNSNQWFSVEMVPGTHPIEELEAALLRIAVNPPESLYRQITEDSRGLVRAIKRVLPPDDRVELVLYIDQFEEVFTQVEGEERREQFLMALATATQDPNSRLHVIISLRADFYDRPLLYQGFGKLVRDNSIVVLPLSREELSEAILGPARNVGVAMEDGLVTHIIDDVFEQPGMLPLLQYALTELFDRRDGRVLTKGMYVDSGGVQGALARRAEALYNALDPDGQEAARQLFLRLVTLGEGTDDTRRRVWRASLDGIGVKVAKVIEVFGRSRLLTFDHDPQTREPTVEVAHEALLREWDRLRRWLDESRDDLRQHRRLTATVREWNAAERDPSFLATGFRLDQLTAWAEASNIALNEDEHEYIAASIAKREAQQAAEAERQAREEALENRSRSRLQALVGVLVVATFIASGLALFAVRAQNEAALQADVNESLALSTGAQLALSDNDTDRAIVLALAANRIEEPPTQAQRSLAEAAFAPGTREVYAAHEGPVLVVDFSTLGSRFVTSGTDGRVLLWNRRSSDIIREFGSPAHEGEVRGTAISPMGDLLLTGGNDGRLLLWSLETGNLIRELEGHEGPIRHVAFGTNSLAASASADGRAIIWDVSSGEALHTLTEHAGVVEGLAFSPDAEKLYTAGDDATMIRWEVETGVQEFTYTGHAGRVNDIEVSPDGRLLATAAGSDNAGFVWDEATGDIIHRLIGHADQPYAVTFSPDGEVVVTASQDGTTRVWNVASGREVQRLLGHAGGIEDVDFDPDGLRLLTAGQDGAARVWDVNSGAEQLRLNEHDVTLYDVAISSDGSRGATAAWDHTALLFDTDTGEVLQRLGAVDNIDPAVGHTNWLTEIEWLPGDEQIMTSSYDSTLILWDVATGEIVRRYEGHAERIWAFNLSPDATLAATASQDGTLRLWDVATGETLWVADNHDGPVRGVSFSPDGQTILSGSGGDQTVRLFDTATGEQLLLLEGSEEWLWHTGYNPADPTTAFSAASDGVILMWDLETGAIIRDFTGHDGPVVDFAVTSDGARLISASSDTTIRVWDVATGRELRRFSGHTSTIWGLELFPDGERVLTGGGDTTARVWDVTFTLEELIAWVGDNRYVGELSCTDREEYQIEPLCEE